MTMPAACSPPTRPFTVQWPAVPPAAVGRSACAKVVTVTPAVIAGAAATTDPSSGSPDNASAPATANATTGSSARRWLLPSDWQVAFAVAADLPRAVVASPVGADPTQPGHLSDRADR